MPSLKHTISPLITPKMAQETPHQSRQLTYLIYDDLQIRKPSLVQSLPRFALPLEQGGDGRRK